MEMARKFVAADQDYYNAPDINEFFKLKKIGTDRYRTETLSWKAIGA